MMEVHFKNGYSERNGIKKFNQYVQIDEFNERTQNLIYNLLDKYINKLDDNMFEHMCRYIYYDILSYAKNEAPYTNKSSFMIISQKILRNNKLTDVLDYLEAIVYYNKIIADANVPGAGEKLKWLVDGINNLFESENVTYRIVDNIFVDLTNDDEIQTIEQCVNSDYEQIRTHIESALVKLYKEKDYRNSIKESISAVEFIVNKISGEKNSTLGTAIKSLEGMPSPLKEAFSKMYGFTSDAEGIRHALKEEDSGVVNYSLAKYMIVTCSAFVNYLTESYLK